MTTVITSTNSNRKQVPQQDANLSYVWLT